MDFIEGLSHSRGVDLILMVADRLSKYAHFVRLKHPFSAKIVVEAFTKKVMHLHDILVSIVYDKG